MFCNPPHQGNSIKRGGHHDLLSGCQSQSAPTPPTSAKGPAVLAAQALAAGRYADAASMYRQALGEAPGAAGPPFDPEPVGPPPDAPPTRRTSAGNRGVTA